MTTTNSTKPAYTKKFQNKKLINDAFFINYSSLGDHKKRAKYRFASKTLMRILPDNLKAEVEGLINAKTMTLDLYEILGQCTWGQGTKGV